MLSIKKNHLWSSKKQVDVGDAVEEEQSKREIFMVVGNCVSCIILLHINKKWNVISLVVVVVSLKKRWVYRK